jgi:hypothetical protein
VLACPYCKHVIEPDERFCPACQLAVRFEPPSTLVAVHPKITPGTSIVRRDLSREAPPEMQARSGTLSAAVRCEERADGVLFHMTSATTRTFRETKHELRDACIGATFTALGPGARIGLCARATTIGEGFTAYALEVSVDARTAWPAIVFSAGKASGSTSLVQKTHVSPSIAPVGKPNAIELRVQGPSLQAFVNGEHVFSIHEPTYGVGVCGLRVGNDGLVKGAALVVCHEFHVSEVAP